MEHVVRLYGTGPPPALPAADCAPTEAELANEEAARDLKEVATDPWRKRAGSSNAGNAASRGRSSSTNTTSPATGLSRNATAPTRRRINPEEEKQRWMEEYLHVR